MILADNKANIETLIETNYEHETILFTVCPSLDFINAWAKQTVIAFFILHTIV